MSDDMRATKAAAWTALAVVVLLSGGGPARATCSLDSVAGAPLVVEEPTSGAWQEAGDAALALLKEAKVAGDLFSRVYLGGYMKQQVQRELDASDEAFAEALARARTALAGFEGSCAGDLLGAAIRKAERYRDPERTMVVNALKGKPIQASQQDIHDGRSLDLRDFERRFKSVVETADVRAAAETPADPPPAPDGDGGSAGEGG